MIWGWSILEFLGWAAGATAGVLGIGITGGWLAGKALGNPPLPTGHSRYCTCPKCLRERADRDDRQPNRHREFKYGDDLYLVNEDLLTTRQLRDYIGCTVLCRIKGDTRMQFYRVVWAVYRSDGMEVGLRHLDSDQMIPVRFPEAVLDRKLWRRVQM